MCTNTHQCCPCAARLAQHPPQVSDTPSTWNLAACILITSRNSVDKRTVIENYDLVVCTADRMHV